MTAVMFGGMQLSASAAADPDLPTENFSSWVGVQPVRDGAMEWLYDGHYVMPDGTHLNTNQNGEPDGSEAIYYDEQTGTLTFSKDITLYGASSASEYKTYYGTAVTWQYAVEDVDQNMAIRLENGANVTLDATNRDAFTYLYGLYGTGTLVITGDGTLTIKANAGTSDNYALCVYNGKEGKTLGNIIIKDNVKLKLEDADDNGIGIGVYGPGAGNITIKDNAVVEAYGGAKAINKAPIIPDTAEVTVGDSAETAQAWDKTSDITQYKYVKINASGEETSEEPTEPEEPVELGIRIGENMLTDKEPTWTNGAVTAVYDIDSDTLTLSGTGSITGPGWEDRYGYGAAIYANKALNIVVAKDADITLNAGTGADGWVYGIYTYAYDADITIGGEGKLTVNSTSDAANSVAICPYGRTADGGYDLTLTGSVDVTANGGAYGIYAWQNKAGWIQIKDSASLTAKGTEKAVLVADFFNSYIYDGKKSFIGTVDGGAWDATNVTKATSISIKPALFTQETSPAMTGTNGKTGFVTTINGTTAGTTIRSIKWSITSNSVTKELSPLEQPNITLDENAQAVFAVIVEGLNDADATATAVVQ